jgi:hypothetical protein
MMGQISAWRFGGMIHGTAEEIGGKLFHYHRFHHNSTRKSAVLRRPLIAQGKTLLLSFKYFLLARSPVCGDRFVVAFPSPS